MIYLLHATLAVTVYLLILNGFLRGSEKAKIDAFLGLLLVVILVTAFAAFGWKVAALAVVLAFVYAGISRPLAARSAAWLQSLAGGPSGAYVGLPNRTLERVSRELGREIRPEDMMRELMTSPNRRDIARSALLDHCASRPELESIVREFGATRATLDDLYHTLCAAGAGQWAGGHFVAASALAYPQTLRFLLQNQRGGLTHEAQACALVMHFERGAPLP